MIIVVILIEEWYCIRAYMCTTCERVDWKTVVTVL